MKLEPEQIGSVLFWAKDPEFLQLYLKAVRAKETSQSNSFSQVLMRERKKEGAAGLRSEEYSFDLERGLAQNPPDLSSTAT